MAMSKGAYGVLPWHDRFALAASTQGSSLKDWNESGHNLHDFAFHLCTARADNKCKAISIFPLFRRLLFPITGHFSALHHSPKKWSHFLLVRSENQFELCCWCQHWALIKCHSRRLLNVLANFLDGRVKREELLMIHDKNNNCCRGQRYHFLRGICLLFTAFSGDIGGLCGYSATLSGSAYENIRQSCRLQFFELTPAMHVFLWTSRLISKWTIFPFDLYSPNIVHIGYKSEIMCT